METVHTPFARPMYIMTKAAGSMCNLACKYCYYLEKNNLYKEQQPDRRFIMTDDTLERFISMYIQSQTTPQVLFCWHGGESLMRPLSFYKRVVELQKKICRRPHHRQHHPDQRHTARRRVVPLFP